MNILIIGFGDIGSAVGENLTKQGHHVSSLKRTASDYHDNIQADITKPLSCSKDFDYVLYILTPSSREEEGYKAVFDVGLKNALGYFSQSIFLFISSSVVYGQNDGSLVDETSKTSKEGMRSRVLVEAEEAVLAYHDKNIVLRLSGIYGRGGRHLITKLQNKEPIQHTPPYYTNKIHRADCIGAIGFIMIKQMKESLKERVYNVTDSMPYTMYHVANLVAKKEGLEVVKATPLKGAPQNKRISNKRLLDEGYVFVYPSFKSDC